MSIPLNLSLFSRLLNAKTIIPTSYTVMNDLTNPGFYYVKMKQLNANAYNGHLLVNSSDDNSRILQLLVNDTTDGDNAGLFIRQRIDGTWSGWAHLLTQDQVTNEVTKLLTKVEF